MHRKGMSLQRFFEEVIRRKVLPVAVAYAIGGWVLLQVGDVLIGLLELPGWVGKILVALVAVGLPVALILAWIYDWTPKGIVATSAKVSTDTKDGNAGHPGLELPDKPSIAVLPFTNMSGDPQQEYFSDGITEDIIIELSRFQGLFVIARNSTFTYKDSPVKVQRVADDLGVRYILEGSVQKAGDTVRITAQLIDGATGGQIWSERYDRELTDVFAVRDEVTRTIAVTMMSDTGKLTRAEVERASLKDTESLEAYELLLQGLNAWLRFTKDANAEGVQLCEKAIAVDPEYARAYALLAFARLNEFRWSWSGDPETSLELAHELAQKAVTLGDSDEWCHWALGSTHLYRGEHDQAVAAYDKAVDINPNYADLLAHSADLMVAISKPDEAIDRLRTAMRLNPHHPDWYLWSLGEAQYYAEHYDDALASMLKITQTSNAGLIILASVYVRLGRVDEARALVATFQTNNPDFSLAHFEQSRRGKFKQRADLDRMIDDLRVAGMR